MLVKLGFIILSILIALSITRKLFTVTKVQGESMYPLLKHNDRLLVLRHYPIGWLQIDQIVTCCPPNRHDKQSQSTNSLFIKQLIGLPGDKVTVHISELDESRCQLLLNSCDRDGNLTWHIPPDYCFVKGQSSDSIDSVSWGPIPLSSLVGLVCFKPQPRSDSVNIG